MTTRPAPSSPPANRAGDEAGRPVISRCSRDGVECLAIDWSFPGGSAGLFRDLELAMKTRVTGDLTLVSGIGKATARAMTSRGTCSLHDLPPRVPVSWRRQASAICSAACRRDLQALLAIKGTRGLDAMGCVDPGDVVVVDIETTGLRGASIFLVALGTFHEDGDTFRVTQYLARNRVEEYAVMAGTMAVLKQKGCVVSYNGKGFDLPFILDRAWYYLKETLDPGWCFHLDLLHEARRAFDLDRRPSLGRLEKDILGMRRDLDVPSATIPGIFEYFMKDGDPGVLERMLDDPTSCRASLSPGPDAAMARVVHHNMHDTWSLVKLLREATARVLAAMPSDRRATAARPLEWWLRP